jgi:hypothetical protein
MYGEQVQLNGYKANPLNRSDKNYFLLRMNEYLIIIDTVDDTTSVTVVNSSLKSYSLSWLKYFTIDSFTWNEIHHCEL